MSKRQWILPVFATLVVSLATFLFLHQRNSSVALHPHRGRIVESIYSLGTVKSNRHYEVKIGVLATLTKVYVREGDSVEKGDPLVQFDSSTLFRSPFAGTVVLVTPSVGETVTPQTVVLRVDDLSDRFIELSLEQEAALRIKKGQKARVSLESLRGSVLEGKVTALYARDSDFLARIEIPDLAPNILPGMTADVSVEVGIIENALLIPIAGLSRGQVSVRRAQGQKEKVKVEIGAVENGWGELKSQNLSETDEILVPQQRE